MSRPSGRCSLSRRAGGAGAPQWGELYLRSGGRWGVESEKGLAERVSPFLAIAEDRFFYRACTRHTLGKI